MKQPVMVLVGVVLQVMPAFARDLVDEKTHEYTAYGVAIALIATAQVSEMRCSTKGQITLALAKAGRLGVPVDLNNKEDYAAVLFQSSQIMTGLQKDGAPSWCKKAAGLDQFLREP